MAKPTFDLKPLSAAGVPQAIERAERYRWLNEPRQAESICRDVLRTEPDNQHALVLLLKALTDQFSDERMGQAVQEATGVLQRLHGDYARAYFAGMIAERKAKAQLRKGVPGFVVYAGLRAAMAHYEMAETLREPDNEDAILRWNTCARIIAAEPTVEPEAPSESGAQALE